MGALDGVRVLDLGLLVQGPQAAQMLGDLGADVIKVELPGIGDQARWIPVSTEDLRAPYFIACNRGKRSITLDLRMEAGVEAFMRLVDTADMVISNFVPGTMARWGLTYERLAERNPRIIYGAASTFGWDSDDAGREGADLAAQAAGGLISTTGTGPDDVGPVGVTIADHIGSQNLVAGVLAALYARERTGRGQKVEVSLVGGQIFAQASEYTYFFLTGKQPGHADRGHPLLPFVYGVFTTADGHIAMVGVTPDQRPAFYDCIERPDMFDDPRFSGFAIEADDRKVLFAMLDEAFSKRTTGEWAEKLRAAGQRFAPVRDYAAVSADEGVFADGYLKHVEHPEWGEISMIGCPVRLSDTPADPGEAAPELGQDTEILLMELGYEWESIEKMREARVI